MQNKRNCEVCGSRLSKKIYHQRFILPSRNAFHSGYDVVICSRCGFCYADNIPGQEFLDVYYKEMTKKGFFIKKEDEMKEKKRMHNEELMMKQRFEVSFTNIKNYLSQDMQILDVGCFTGNLLYMLKRKGFKHVLGLDPSPFAVDVAKKKYGVKVIEGNLFDNLDLGQFDFIILTHVMEHIKELRNFLFTILGYLNENGLIYIESPDADNFFISTNPQDQFRPEHKEPFQQFSVEHINFFTKVSLYNLMKRNGFENVLLESQVSVIAVLASIWRKTGIFRDYWIDDKMARYTLESKRMLKGLLTKIDKFTKEKEIVVWGAGVHTQKLLANSTLIHANIRAFVDSDPAYRGGTLINKPIISPDELNSLPSLPILISSETYQDEIIKQIKTMGLKNKLLLLYKRSKA